MSTYFEADKTEQVEALVDSFGEHGVVKDEGETYQGHKEIRAWWRRAKNKYHHVAEPVSATDGHASVAVLARVTGDFPNSPATLGFRFRLIEGKIEQLEIG